MRPLTVVRWSLMAAIAVSLTWLLGLTWMVANYVGDISVRCEAMRAGAGHYDVWRGVWLWTPGHPSHSQPQALH